MFNFLKSKPEVVIIIGPQGSGKGTQGKMLAKEFGYEYWETGAILRHEVEQETVLGKRIADTIRRGQMVPDEVIIQLMLERLPEQRHPRIIFDGITRKMRQTQFLLSYLTSHKYKRIVTLVIDIPKAESIKRLAGRAKLESRPDDTPEAIALRLALYERETLPVIKYLRKHTVLYSVSGMGSIEAVYAEIKKQLGL